MTIRRISTLAPVLAALALAAGPAAGDPVADFYKGRTVTIISGYGGGSTYTLYARALAHHMPRHLPGGPTIIVKTMTGSGSMRAASYLFTAAPKDGATLGALGRGVGSEPLIFGKRSRMKFDPLDFHWLGSLNSEVSVAAAWETTGIKTLDDATRKSIFIPTGGATSDSAVFTFLTNALLGTKFRLVAGYRGGDSQNVALEQGEVQGRVGWSWSSIKATKLAWLKDGKITLLAQYALKKHPDLPNVPLILDLAKSKDDREILSVAMIRQSMGRPYVAPPGVPAARVAALRAAFAGTFADPRFLAEAKKTRLEINEPRTGAQVTALLKRGYALPQSLKDKVAAAADRRNAELKKRQKKKK